MSVINSMLRDLDRRHASSPFKGNDAIHTNVQPALVNSKRVAPRSAIALSVLIILVILSWSRHSARSTATMAEQPLSAQSEKNESAIAENNGETISLTPAPLPTGEGESVPTNSKSAPQKNEAQRQEISAAQSPLLPGEGKGEGKLHATSALTPAPLPVGEGRNSKEVKAEIAETESVDSKSQTQAEIRNIAPIIKQERKPIVDLTAERYQLARNALTQNQPERAYELLRANPPALASNTDYHAVLAAVEQQLKHFAEASLRYQQLLIVDQNQASWWLGLALSLEGQQRSTDALGAYRRALSLNSLPDAARQYAAARIAALEQLQHSNIRRSN